MNTTSRKTLIKRLIINNAHLGHVRFEEGIWINIIGKFHFFRNRVAAVYNKKLASAFKTGEVMIFVKRKFIVGLNKVLRSSVINRNIYFISRTVI